MIDTDFEMEIENFKHNINKMENTEKFESWAIVEIMGHTKCAGLAKTMTFGGTVMLRIDIPETKAHPAHSKMYGMSSVFSISPCDEEMAKRVAENWQIRPIIAYETEQAIKKQVQIGINDYINNQNPALPEHQDDFGDSQTADLF